MLTDESDLSTRSIGELSPTEWDQFRRQAIDRAHQARSEMAAKLFRKFFGALIAGISVAATSAVTALRRWQIRRQDRAAISRLHALDDGALRDIGIRRSEIESIVHAHGQDDTRARNDERLAA